MSDYKTPVQALIGAINETGDLLGSRELTGMRLTDAEFGQRRSEDGRFYYALTVGMRITSGPTAVSPADTTWKDRIVQAWEREFEVSLRPATPAG
jgi:hypothetical protein